MTAKNLKALRAEYDRLAEQVEKLLDGARTDLDPGIVAFVKSYVPALEQDLLEVTGTTSEGRGALLAMIVGELKDLVLELQNNSSRWSDLELSPAYSRYPWEATPSLKKTLSSTHPR